MDAVKILLASNSPRRRQMLQWIGVPFRVSPVDIDETPWSGEAPEPYVRRLAETKALAARGLVRDETLILAADTIVADGNRLLGKPSGPEEAGEMLRALRGRVHRVCTALAVLLPGAENPVVDLCISQVPMRNYSDPEIDRYIATGDPLDKAGAYAIQHLEFRPVVEFQGCFASVMGLPLCHLLRVLKKAGAEFELDMVQICRENLEYPCMISERVKAGENIG